MRSIWVIVQAVLLIAAAGAGGPRAGRRKADSGVLRQITEGGASFTMQLFNTILDEKDGNVIFSPLSVQLALALLYPATRGDSAALLARALDLPASLDDVYTGYSDLMAMFKHPKLKIANRIFVDDTTEIKEDYKRNAEMYFHAGAQTVSFRKELTKSVNLINKWVEQVTKNKIKDLLRPDSLGSDTRIVLVNAIHFKAKWEKEFDKLDTDNQNFHVSMNKQVQVKMMHVDGYYNYYHDTNLKAKIISMPFKGDRFKMYVVLPDEVDGIDAVVERMDAGKGWNSSSLQQVFVKLSLPKFKVETEITLNDVLIKHGIGSLFTSEADLSGLSDSKDLTISKVLQKAVIDVNEGGVEAAAATVVGAGRSRPTEPEVEFEADHPFLFIIKAVRRGREIPLFAGRYSGPD